jgi:hypothetical protein
VNYSDNKYFSPTNWVVKSSKFGDYNTWEKMSMKSLFKTKF